MMDTVITLMNDSADSWAFVLGHAAWQAALVGIVLLLIVRLGHRWPAPLRYGLLLLALLKFAMPPILPAPTGIISQFATPLTARVTTVAPVESVEPFPFPADYSNESDVPSTETLTTTVPSTADSPETTTIVTATLRPHLTWQTWALLIYAMGVIGYALWAIWQLLGLRGIVFRSTPVTSGDLYNEHLRLCRTLGLRTPPRLLFTNEAIGPMAFGVFAPTIVLPQSVGTSLSPRETEAMLAHEIAHHRRRDPWVIGFQIVLNAVWWFHPVLWLLNRSVRKTREDCCDDLLLSSGITRGEDYCDTLLHVASGLAVRSVHGTELGFMEGWHPLGRRIKRIMDPSLRRSARLSLAGGLLLLALGLVFLPGLRMRAEETKPIASSPESIASTTSTKSISSPESTTEVEWEAMLDRERIQKIELNNNDIRSVLPAFAKASGFDVTLASDVNGTVTAYLHDKTLREALDALLLPNGWVWERHGGIITVSKNRSVAESHIGSNMPVNKVPLGFNDSACPLIFAGSQTKDATQSYEWYIDRRKPLKLVHGWYTLIDGVVAEYAGGGVSGEPATGTMKLSLESGIDEGMITLKLGKAEGAPGDLKQVKVVSRTTMPDRCTLKQNAVTRIGQLTSTLTTLWECRCIVDGTTVKTIRYAARVADASEQVSGFEPPAEYRGRKPTNAPLLQFRLVAEPGETGDIEELPGHGRSSGRAESFRVFKEVLLDEKDIELAETSHNTNGPEDRWIVNLTFTEQGKEKFKEVTQQNVGHILAIIYDGKVLSAPTIQMAITGGRAQITGSFDQAEAERIAATINERTGAATASKPLFQLRVVAESDKTDKTELIPNRIKHLGQSDTTRVLKSILLDEKDVNFALPTEKHGLPDSRNGWEVNLFCTQEGARKLGEAAGQEPMVAVIYEGKVLSAPRILNLNDWGKYTIGSYLNKEQAESIASAINERVGRKALKLRGIIKDSNGNPTANAQVMTDYSSHITLRNWSIPASQRITLATAASGEDGRFVLPTLYGTCTLIVYHEKGFAKLTTDILAATPTILLQPWGRIEGTLRIGNSPGSHEKIVIVPVVSSTESRSGKFWWDQEVVTAGDGGFVVDHVPPGTVEVMRVLRTDELDSGAGTHVVRAMVRTNETSIVTIGGTGRPVIGLIKEPDWLKGKMRWDSTSVTAIPIIPEGTDAATRASWSCEEKQGRAWRDPISVFRGIVNKDGMFRIDDLPAGHYDVIIQGQAAGGVKEKYAIEGQLMGIPPHRIGCTEITIPEMPGGRMDEPLNAGTVELIDQPTSLEKALGKPLIYINSNGQIIPPKVH